MKKYRVKISTHFPNGEATIYTLQEAKENEIKYYPYPDGWRKAQEGEYAETSDGYVTPIIRRNDNKSASYIKTPTGCFNQFRKGTVFDTKEFYDRNRYSRGTRWNGNSKKINAKQEAFFNILRSTFNLDLAFSIIYPTCGPDRKVEFVQSKLFREHMIDFKKLLESNGVTEEYIAEKIRAWLEEGDTRDRVKLLQMAGAILGVKGMTHETSTPRRPALFSGIDEAEFEDSQPKQLVPPTSVN